VGGWEETGEGAARPDGVRREGMSDCEGQGRGRDQGARAASRVSAAREASSSTSFSLSRFDCDV
jgi:hypothetical protein